MDKKIATQLTGYRLILLTAILFGSLILNVPRGDAMERRLVPDTERKTIVLDPGHGGSDTGAQGPNGVLEKDVSLQIAQMIAMRLRNTYRVVLSRSDDYSLSLTKRTEVANHHKADLFLSIHTGGDFLHTKSGVTVYSYQEKMDATLSAPSETPNPVSFGSAQVTWDRIQAGHRAASKQLAKEIYDRFCGEKIETQCRIERAPLMVLMGADMPAALLEVGYITNPMDERKLDDRGSLTEIATEISEAMDAFLASRSDVSDP